MANTGVIRTLSGGAQGWATRAEYLADAGSGQLSQTLLRGTSFWLTASRTRPDRGVQLRPAESGRTQKKAMLQIEGVARSG